MEDTSDITLKTPLIALNTDSQNLPNIPVDNSDAFLDEKLILELSQNMADLTQDDPSSDKPSVSQEP